MPSDLTSYRSSLAEQQRIADLFALLPASGCNALDIGARDGYFSRMLAERFDRVVALDLEKPDIEHPKIVPMQGNIADSKFSDNQFDAVLCAEVLEHIPPHLLTRSCHEIARIARNKVVIGVPYRQDLRCGRTTCANCGKTNPPWGHVNSFDENRLRMLFPALILEKMTFVGFCCEGTNSISTALLDYAGNPYGTWQQDEPCIHCGGPIGSPKARNPFQRISTRVAFLINRFQGLTIKPHGNWIHVLFAKPSATTTY